MVAGVGLGLMTAVVLVEQELLTPQRKIWVMGPGMILFLIGVARLWATVERERQAETPSGR
jgi:hypothetical protein